MAAAHITRRRWLNARGETVTRYHVRGRLGGRGWPLIHFGSFKTVREAEVRLRFIEDEIAAGRDPRQTLDASAEKATTVAAMAEKWLDSRRDYAERTAKRVRIDVNRIAHSAIGRKPVGAVTRDDVERHIRDDLAGSGLSAGSIRNAMATLKQVIDYAGIEPNPARSRSIRLPKTEREPVTVPSRDEAEAIKRAARGDYRLAIRMLEATGARSQELCNCEWRDFDLDGKRWRIRGTKTATSLRTVPLPDDVVEALAGRERTTDQVFPAINISTMWDHVSKSCKRAGTVAYNPKSFRHLYGSRLVAAGVPIPEVARLMGHVNQTTTMKFYLHVLPDNAGSDVQVMDAIG